MLPDEMYEPRAVTRRRPRDTPYRRRYKIHARVAGTELDAIDTESARLGLSRGSFVRLAVLHMVQQRKKARGEDVEMSDLQDQARVIIGLESKS